MVIHDTEVLVLVVPQSSPYTELLKAEMNDVSEQSVEKCIRNSLIKAWTDNGGALGESYPSCAKKPTNRKCQI